LEAQKRYGVPEKIESRLPETKRRILKKNKMFI
jgi:hypothetical protein